MKRINVMVSDEAKEIIVVFKNKKQYRTLDESVDKFILENECAEHPQPDSQLPPISNY